MLRPEGSPFLFLRVIVRGIHDEFHQFMDLETGGLRHVSSPQVEWFAVRREWVILKRSHPAMPSGSVDTDHSNPTTVASGKRNPS